MNTNSTTQTPPSAAPIGPHTRQKIVQHLNEAAERARADLPGELDRVRALTADVVARIDGITLCLSTATANAHPRAQLAVTALARDGNEPVNAFLLIPFGEVRVERPIAGDSFHFTRRHAESAQRWFEQMGRKLAIDYEHQSFDRLNSRPDGLRPAAGWIGGLEVRDDGLWATNVTWTERARDLLRSGEYRYFSPVLYWSDEDQTDIAALGPVALTNDPAMRGVPSLAASREQPEDPLVLRRRLHAVEAERDELRAQALSLAADMFIDEGLRQGKIVDSTRADWRVDYLRDPAATQARLSRAPVLLPPGRVLALDRRGHVPPLPQRLPGDRAAGVESEDLEAFEQARTAGRVQGTWTPTVA